MSPGSRTKQVSGDGCDCSWDLRPLGECARRCWPVSQCPLRLPRGSLPLAARKVDSDPPREHEQPGPLKSGQSCHGHPSCHPLLPAARPGIRGQASGLTARFVTAGPAGPPAPLSEACGRDQVAAPSLLPEDPGAAPAGPQRSRQDSRGGRRGDIPPDLCPRPEAALRSPLARTPAGAACPKPPGSPQPPAPATAGHPAAWGRWPGRPRGTPPSSGACCWPAPPCPRRGDRPGFLWTRKHPVQPHPVKAPDPSVAVRP